MELTSPSGLEQSDEEVTSEESRKKRSSCVTH